MSPWPVKEFLFSDIIVLVNTSLSAAVKYEKKLSKIKTDYKT